MYKLIIHQWKEKLRSTFWQKSLIFNILLGLFGLYMLTIFLVIGFFSDVIIQEIYKTKDTVNIFTGLLYYYFAFDLILRFLAQELPILSIQPYLTLPIKKRTLLHYPLIKSIPSFFNIAPLLIFIPFFVKVIIVTQTPIFSIAWIITLLSMIATNNFLNFSVKKYFLKKPLLIFALLAIIGALLYLDISKIVSISEYFSNSIKYISNNPIFAIIPILITAIAYFASYLLLKKNSYLENNNKTSQNSIAGFAFLNRFGEIGILIQIELKMLFRNKRPKSMLYMSMFFLFYGFIIYTKEYIHNDFMMILGGIVLTSIFSLSYGQMFFSWEGSFFDSFLANKISTSNYIKSKYVFLAVTSAICYILTLPYALISYKIGIINTALCLYNIGISSIIMISLSTFNKKSMDLGKGQMMNYQGMGVVHFLSTIPILGVPILTYSIFEILGFPQYGFYALGFIGILGIGFNKYLLRIVTNLFVKRKYNMALGFRQR